MRRAVVKRDRDHAVVVDALRMAGFAVHDTSALGGGFPDLVVAEPGSGLTVLLEVKNEADPPSARRLTVAERLFHKTWPGACHIVAGPRAALEVMGVRHDRAEAIANFARQSRVRRR